MVNFSRRGFFTTMTKGSIARPTTLLLLGMLEPLLHGRLLAACLCIASLAGCVAYEPEPPQLAVFPAALQARRLDGKAADAPWSGTDLLGAALAQNPHIAEARAKYVTAVAAARAAKIPVSPSLTLTAEYASEHPRWGGGAAVDLPLDIGGRRATRLATADLQALQSWYDLGEAAWAVRTAIARARAELLSAADELPLAERLVSLRRDRLDRQEMRIRAGEDSRALSLIALSDLIAAERRLADAKGRRLAAATNLAQALGVTSAVLSDLFVAPMAPMAIVGEVDTLRRDAALSRRDVLRAIVAYDLAENALRLEVARQYPEVRLGPGYTYDHGIDKLPFGLSLVLPSYDLNRRNIEQAEAARAAAGRSLEAIQADVFAEVDAAAGALNLAKANEGRVSVNTLPASRAAAAAAARAVAQGRGDRVDDLAAQGVEIEAELSLLDAKLATVLAGIAFENALRRPFDADETATLQAALDQPASAKKETR